MKHVLNNCNICVLYFGIMQNAYTLEPIRPVTLFDKPDGKEDS